MTLQIKKAVKSESKLRLALVGPSGSGKTFTALSVATNLGKKVLVVDTEAGSAAKYADIFEFDVIELETFDPRSFVEAIRLAEKNQYEVVILDSLSHAWMGKGGVLDLHGDAEKRVKNSFAAWKDVTPLYLDLVEAIVQSKIHVIGTMRAKTDYSVDRDEKGKTQVKTLGLAPVMRDGMEYEFDVVAQLDLDNNFIVQKSRCPQLSGRVFPRAGADVAGILAAWLEGTPRTVVKMPQPAVKPVNEDTDSKELENENLIRRIRSEIEMRNKPEAAFNTWFKDAYDTDMDWTKAGVGILRELLGRVQSWKKAA